MKNIRYIVISLSCIVRFVACAPTPVQSATRNDVSDNVIPVAATPRDLLTRCGSLLPVALLLMLIVYHDSDVNDGNSSMSDIFRGVGVAGGGFETPLDIIPGLW